MRDGWREVRLGQVTEQVRRERRVVVGQSYDLLGVRWYGHGPFLRERGVGGEIKATRLFETKAGDLIYNRLFAWKGSFGVVSNELGGCFVSGEFPMFSVDPVHASPAFINLALCQPAVWSVIERQSTGSTAASRNRWKEERFCEWPLLLPPLEQQVRIVDLVAAVDKAVAATERRPAKAEAATALLNEAQAGADYRPLSEVVVRAKAGGTPSRAKALNFAGDILWLKSGEVDDDSIDTTHEAISEAALAASSAWLMPPRTVVIAMYGQGSTAGTVGFTAAAMASNQAVLGLVPDTRVVDDRFLFHLLRSRKESMRARRSGSSQPNLNKELVLQEPVPVLPLPKQREIADLLDALMLQRLALQRSNGHFRTLRSALLYDLLHGDHEIPASYDELLRA